MTTARTTDVEPDGSNASQNALLGAVATLLATPLLPLAPVLGGGLAGYLQRGDLVDGARIGAVAGALAAVPSFLAVWFVGAYLTLGAVHLSQFASALAVATFLGVLGYYLALGGLGGALGAHLRAEI
jgi:hypothetical protein